MTRKRGDNPTRALQTLTKKNILHFFYNRILLQFTHMLKLHKAHIFPGKMSLYKSIHFFQKYLSITTSQMVSFLVRSGFNCDFWSHQEFARRTGLCDDNYYVCYDYFCWFAPSSFVFIVLHQSTNRNKKPQ